MLRPWSRKLLLSIAISASILLMAGVGTAAWLRNRALSPAAKAFRKYLSAEFDRLTEKHGSAGRPPECYEYSSSRVREFLPDCRLFEIYYSRDDLPPYWRGLASVFLLSGSGQIVPCGASQQPMEIDWELHVIRRPSPLNPDLQEFLVGRRIRLPDERSAENLALFLDDILRRPGMGLGGALRGDFDANWSEPSSLTECRVFNADLWRASWRTAVPRGPNVKSKSQGWEVAFVPEEFDWFVCPPNSNPYHLMDFIVDSDGCLTNMKVSVSTPTGPPPPLPRRRR